MDWIEKLAREHGTGGWQTLEDMVRFGKAVAEEEREACARVCEKTINVAGTNVVANRFANAIRLRSNAGAEPREASASGNLLYDTRKNT